MRPEVPRRRAAVRRRRPGRCPPAARRGPSRSGSAAARGSSAAGGASAREVGPAGAGGIERAVRGHEDVVDRDAQLPVPRILRRTTCRGSRSRARHQSQSMLPGSAPGTETIAHRPRGSRWRSSTARTLYPPGRARPAAGGTRPVEASNAPAKNSACARREVAEPPVVHGPERKHHGGAAAAPELPGHFVGNVHVHAQPASERIVDPMRPEAIRSSTSVERRSRSAGAVGEHGHEGGSPAQQILGRRDGGARHGAHATAAVAAGRLRRGGSCRSRGSGHARPLSFPRARPGVARPSFRRYRGRVGIYHGQILPRLMDVSMGRQVLAEERSRSRRGPGSSARRRDDRGEGGHMMDETRGPMETKP